MTRIGTLSLVLGLALLGCGQPQERTGTNTNWLRACVDNSECGGLACSCGHCTATCTADSDCATVGGICSTAAGFQLRVSRRAKRAAVLACLHCRSRLQRGSVLLPRRVHAGLGRGKLR